MFKVALIAVAMVVPVIAHAHTTSSFEWVLAI